MYLARIVKGDSTMENTHQVFVYGTLKHGYGNYKHFLAGNSNFVGPAVSCDNRFLMRTTGYFPVAKFVSKEACKLVGEIYNCIDDKTLARLDRLEGNGTLYNRERFYFNCTPDYKDRPDVERYVLKSAWIYLFMQDLNEEYIVEDGIDKRLKYSKNEHGDSLVEWV